MKKTTIYLEDDEYQTLRSKAFVENVSVAELIRRGAKLVCSSASPEEQRAMKALDKIRKHVAASGASETEISREVLAEQKAVRHRAKK